MNRFRSMYLDKDHQRFFDCHAKSWDSEDEKQKFETLERIFREINCRIDGPVLDIGCGTGILVPVLQKQPGMNQKIIEFDFSLEMLRQNRSKRQSYKNGMIYLNGDAHYLPFASQQFNFLVCFAILPHLSDHGRAFKEWLRVLRYGGRLLILHLMSSERLNQLHAQVGQEVQQDHLLPAVAVAEQLRSENFEILQAEEQDNLYLILAQKR